MNFAGHFPLRARSLLIPFAAWEMALMRLGLALLVFSTLPVQLKYQGAPFPNGIAHLIDVTFLLREGLWPLLRWLTLPALALYAAGRFSVVALGYVVALVLTFGALANSQGAINHSRQMLAMVLLAQWLVVLWDAGAAARRGDFRFWKDGPERQRKLMHAARVMMAASYLTCAFTKLQNSDGAWLWRTPNLAVQIVKTHANYYYDTLEPTPELFAKKVPQWMVEHPHLSRVFFAPGMLLELLLFLGLLGRGWSLVLGLSTVALHWGIGVLMMLFFDQHVWLLFIFFVNAPYWLVAAAKGIARRLAKPRILAQAS